MIKPIGSLPLTKGSYAFTQADVDTWQAKYPNCVVMDELRKFKAFLTSDPQKRKTRQQIDPAIHGWLSFWDAHIRISDCYAEVAKLNARRKNGEDVPVVPRPPNWPYSEVQR